MCAVKVTMKVRFSDSKLKHYIFTAKVWGGPCFNVTGDTLIGNKSAETKVDCNTCYVGGRQLENGSCKFIIQ